MKRGQLQQKLGFSLVEIMIVVAVIGILASIVLLTFPGYQKQGNDTQRKSDLSQIAAAMSAYAQQKNTAVATGSGCGLNGNGNGWLNATTSDISTYPRAITACLQDAKVLGTGTFTDPSGCRWADGTSKCGSSGGIAQAYMKATCTKSGATVTYLFAHLETVARQDATIDALCDSGSVSDFTSTSQKWGTNYAMNYYVQVR